MLVDDEPIILQGLLSIVDWEAEGFSVVCTATNGFEGIEQYLDHEPDAVITDISMRFMDGLEFIRNIRRLNNHAEVAVISAFDRFEYAQQACALNVREYILKPLTPENIREALQGIRTHLDERRSLTQRIEGLVDYTRQQQETMISMARKQILTGRYRSEEAEYAQLPEITPGEALRVLLLQIGAERDSALLSVPICGILEETLGPSFAYAVILEERRIAVLLRISPGAGDALAPKLDQCIALINERFDVDVTAAMGGCVFGYKEARLSFQAAEHGLNTSLALGVSGLSHIEEIIPLSDRYQYPDDLEEQILYLIPGGDSSKLAAICATLKQRLAGHEEFMPFTVLALFLKAFNRYAEWNVRLLSAYSGWMCQLEEASARTVDEALEKLRCLLNQMINMRMTDGVFGSYMDNVISRAKQYALEHMGNADMTIKDVASALYISCSYFGRLFKRETGQSFGAYLTQVRIERARVLLLIDNMLVRDVAQAVGFDSQPYFQVVFKKIVGVTPGNYRGRKNR